MFPASDLPIAMLSIDWDSAPTWAKAHMTLPSGNGIWLSSAAIADGHCDMPHALRVFLVADQRVLSGCNCAAGADWSQSLVLRPGPMADEADAVGLLPEPPTVGELITGLGQLADKFDAMQDDWSEEWASTVVADIRALQSAWRSAA